MIHQNVKVGDKVHAPEDCIIDKVGHQAPISEKEGFKTADESHTKGKLEATERHLTDMRTLLKLK